MPYFLSSQPLALGATLSLAGEEAAHLLKTRRIRPGERLILQDGEGRRFEAELLQADGGRATVRVLEAAPVPPLPAVRVHLLQAAVKDKAAEWIIQKATEVGVAAITFFPGENSTVPKRQLAASRALGRWDRIAREACKQCDRQWPPGLRALPGLDAALAETEPGARAWLLHGGADLAAGAALREAPHSATARVLVGPEGGFTEGEVAQAERAGFTAVRLGGLTLRAEAAAVSACGLLLFGE
jgi:16S rRNA (uracil1498-N3)-methyltransferase